MKSESVQDNVLWSPVRSRRAGKGTRVTCSLASMTVSLRFLAPHIFPKRLRRGPYLYLIGNHHFVDWSQILIWNNGAQLVVSQSFRLGNSLFIRRVESTPQGASHLIHYSRSYLCSKTEKLRSKLTYMHLAVNWNASLHMKLRYDTRERWFFLCGNYLSPSH